VGIVIGMANIKGWAVVTIRPAEANGNEKMEGFQ
jgi:hypothetical protein